MRNTINTLQKKVDSMTEEVDSKEKEVLKLKAEKYESRKELYKKAGLTLREKRICEIIIDSNIIENKLIGRELGERHSDAIGVKAVERELTSIYAKFGLSNKKQFRRF